MTAFNKKFIHFESLMQDEEHVKVMELMCSEGSNWKWDIINMLLNDRDKGEILKLVMTYLKGEDRRI